jgi:hypothetical protein
MAEASRRAGRRPERGGLANALFVVAAAEALPPELDGLAALVTVHFPWGSLLRGLLAAEPAVLGGLTRILRPGGSLRLLVSATVPPGCWRRGCGPGPGQRSSARRGPAWSRRPAAASMPAQGSGAASRSATVRRVWRPGTQPSSSDQSSGIETGAPGRARTA